MQWSETLGELGKLLNPALATLDDFEARAKRRLPRLAYDFIAGGADEETTLRANRSRLRELTLRPGHLVDVTERDQTTTAMGTPLRTPVMIAPTGMSRLAGREGDLAGAGAAGEAGTIFTVSTMSSYTLEEIAEKATGDLWFQLYLWRQAEVIETMIDRVAAAGYKALVVTTDVPVIGKRARDVRNGFSWPPSLRIKTAADMLRHPRWLRQQTPPPSFANFVEGGGVSMPKKAVEHAKYVNSVLSNPGATSEDLRRVRERWQGALLVKGVLTGEEAVEAVEAGADGIIVSNHGGRQLDGCPAAIDALPEVVAALAGRDVEVYLDGGIRTGTDVVRAVALGARACLIGRPWLYGLAVDGQAGVARVLEILSTEIDNTLALIGRPRLSELDPSILTRLPAAVASNGGGAG